MFRPLRHSVRSSQGSSNRLRTRPAVEALEDRTVLSTLTVTTPADAGAGSLRQAIDQANAAPGSDTIVFAPAIRGSTIALSTSTNPAASTAAVPQPAGPSAFLITSPIAIEGTGETLARVGASDFRLFQVTAAGSLTLQNLTLRDGRAVGGAGGGGGGGAAGMGGAIYNQGQLGVIGCTLLSNQAVGGTSAGGFGGGGGGLGGPNNNSQGGAPDGGAVRAPGGFGGGGGAGAGSTAGDSLYGGGGGGGAFGGRPGFGGGGGGGSTLGGTAGPGVFGGAGSTSGAGAGSGLGGAIFNEGGQVAVFNSTFTTNTAQGGNASGGGQNGGGYGGAIFNLDGSLTLTNVTIAGNSVAAGTGGAVNNALGGALYTASVDVGNVLASHNAVAHVANSIFSFAGPGSTVHNYQDTPAATGILDAAGPNIVLGLVANHNGIMAGTSFTVTDPKLGPLQNNGGPTETMALLAGSPAIDAGSNAAASAAGLITDQRGFVTRAVGGVADIGAFESGAKNPPGSTGGPAGVIGIQVSIVKVKRRRVVSVTNPTTGAVKFTVSPFGKGYRGKLVLTTADVNGDGVADLVARRPRGRKRFLTEVFNGVDGSSLPSNLA